MTDLKEEIPAQWFLTQEETLTQEEFFTQFIQKETLTQEPGGVFFHPGGYYRIGGNPRLETNLRVNQKEVRDW